MRVLFFLAFMAATDGVSDNRVYSPRVVRKDAGAYALAVDEKWLFVLDGEGLYAIERGGRQMPLASKKGAPNSTIALDADHIYFIAEDSVWKTPKPGRPGTTMELAKAGGALCLAVDQDFVYFPDTHVSQVYRVSKSGGELKPLVQKGMDARGRLVPHEQFGPGVLADGRFVYWSFVDTLSRVDRNGGESMRLATTLRIYPLSLAADDEWVYYSSQYKVFRVRKVGGAAPEVIQPWPPARRMTLAGGWLYVDRRSDLYRLSRDGRQLQVLDDGSPWRTALTADSRTVYWADAENKPYTPAIMALAPDEPQNQVGLLAGCGLGKPDFKESVQAVRGWVRALAMPNLPFSIPAPMHIHINSDRPTVDSRHDETMDTSDLVRELGEALRHIKHPLLEFRSRLGWQPLVPAKIDPRWAAEKKSLYGLAERQMVLISHRPRWRWNRECGYDEMIVAVTRVGKVVAPTRVYFWSQNECD